MTTKKRQEDRRSMKLFAGRFGIVITIGLLLFTELVSFSILKARENPRPFLVDTSANYARGVKHVGGMTEMSYLDPHLGHAHNPAAVADLGELPGFAVYGRGGSDMTEQGIRIITLGGSTTDPVDPDNWPKALQAALSSKGIRSQVFNGGVSGYSSNQELLKMIRDALPLKPDIIISLNGLNDLGFCHSVPGHPMVHPYQEGVLRSITDKKAYLFPCTVHIVKRAGNRLVPEVRGVTGMNLGPEIQTTPSAQWEGNVRMMHAVAEEFEIVYLCFLHPTMGVGDYNPSPDEEEMLRYANEQREGKYLDQVEEFYREAKETCKRLPYCTDLTDALRGKTNMYRNARHQNANGYKVIAEAIFRELEGRGLLEEREE